MNDRDGGALPSKYDGHLAGSFPGAAGQKRSGRNPPHNDRGCKLKSLDKAAIPIPDRMAALVSDFSSFCQEERVLHVDAEIAHRVLDLGVTKQDLDRADVPVAR